MVYRYPCWMLIIIACCVFMPTLFNDFQLKWDDNWQVLENPYIADHSWQNLLHHFTSFYGGQYSPVNTLMYILVYKLFGFDPFGFHLVCLLIHLGNILLVFYVIQDVVEAVKPAFSYDRLQLYAFFTALVFAIHPLQVESVAWISASKVIMFSFFSLLAFRAYQYYIRSQKGIWLVVVGVLYTLGFGSKEQAIVLPLNLLAFDYIYRRFETIKFNFSLLRKSVFVEKIPFFLLALVFWYFSWTHGLGTIESNGYPLYQRVILGMHSFMEYIFRTIAPAKLYFYYFFPMQKGDPLPVFYWGYIGLVAIVWLFVWGHITNKNKLVLFGVLIFFINLLLVLHILPMPRDYITADRFMYLSIIGLTLVGVWHADYFLARFRPQRKYTLPIVICYFLFYGVHSFCRTMQWKDSATMKKNMIDLIEKRKKAGEYIGEYPVQKYE